MPQDSSPTQGISLSRVGRSALQNSIDALFRPYGQMPITILVCQFPRSQAIMDPVFDESANTITLDRRLVDALQDDELIAYMIDKSQALKQLESFSEGKQADIRFKNIAQNTAFFALLGLLA